MGIRYALRKATQSLRFSNVIPACGNDWRTVFIIHKRELSDSRVESGSSLFYLLHCSAYDRLNTTTFRSFRNIPHGLHQSSGHNHRCCNNFASAHPAQIASNWIVDVELQYQLCLSISRTDCILLDGNVYWWHDLCLSTSRTDCIKANLSKLSLFLVFASADPARIASAKLHRCNATNPRNML